MTNRSPWRSNMETLFRATGIAQDLICLLGVAFIEASGVRQVESQYWVVLGRKPLLNEFRIDEAWKLALFDVAGLSRVAV